jgi:hypothetical protein
MIGVAFESRVFDPIGHAWVEALPGSELSAAVRRVTRTATLDGRAALIDMGYTASDATFKVIARPDPFNEAQLLRLVRVYPEVICSTPEGCFLGVIEDVRKDASGKTVISFLVQEALAEPHDVAENRLPPEPAPAEGWLMMARDYFDGQVTHRTPIKAGIYYQGVFTPIAFPEGTTSDFGAGGGYSNLQRIGLPHDGAGEVLLPAVPRALYSTDWGQTTTVSNVHADYDRLAERAIFLPAESVYVAPDAWLYYRRTTQLNRATSNWTRSLCNFPNYTQSHSDARIEAFCEFQGKIYAVILDAAPDPGNPYRTIWHVKIVRTSSFSPTDWSVVYQGTIHRQWSSYGGQYFWLFATEDRLVCLDKWGITLISLNGTTWEKNYTPLFLDFGQKDQEVDSLAVAVSGSTVVVLVTAFERTREEPPQWGWVQRFYVAENTLAFSEVTLPNAGFNPATDRFFDVAAGEGKFCLVGSQARALEFTAPATFKALELGFDPAAPLCSVIYLPAGAVSHA